MRRVQRVRRVRSRRVRWGRKDDAVLPFDGRATRGGRRTLLSWTWHLCFRRETTGFARFKICQGSHDASVQCIRHLAKSPIQANKTNKVAAAARLRAPGRRRRRRRHACCTRMHLAPGTSNCKPRVGNCQFWPFHTCIDHSVGFSFVLENWAELPVCTPYRAPKMRARVPDL